MEVIIIRGSAIQPGICSGEPGSGIYLVPCSGIEQIIGGRVRRRIPRQVDTARSTGRSRQRWCRRLHARRRRRGGGHRRRCRRQGGGGGRGRGRGRRAYNIYRCVIRSAPLSVREICRCQELCQCTKWTNRHPGHTRLIRSGSGNDRVDNIRIRVTLLCKPNLRHRSRTIYRHTRSRRLGLTYGNSDARRHADRTSRSRRRGWGKNTGQAGIHKPATSQRILGGYIGRSTRDARRTDVSRRARRRRGSRDSARELARRSGGGEVLSHADFISRSVDAA